MKNKNTLVLAFIAVVLSLAACSKQADVTPENANPEVTKVDSGYKPPKDPTW